MNNSHLARKLHIVDCSLGVVFFVHVLVLVPGCYQRLDMQPHFTFYTYTLCGVFWRWFKIDVHTSSAKEQYDIALLSIVGQAYQFHEAFFNSVAPFVSFDTWHTSIRNENPSEA